MSKIFCLIINLNRIIEEKSYLLINSLNKLKSTTEEKNKKEKENISMFNKLTEMRNKVESLMEKKKNNLSSTKSNNCKFNLKKNFDNNLYTTSKENDLNNNLEINNTITNINDHSGYLNENEIQEDNSYCNRESNNIYVFDDDDDDNEDVNSQNKTEKR